MRFVKSTAVLFCALAISTYSAFSQKMYYTEPLPKNPECVLYKAPSGNYLTYKGAYIRASGDCNKVSPSGKSKFITAKDLGSALEIEGRKVCVTTYTGRAVLNYC